MRLLRSLHLQVTPRQQWTLGLKADPVPLETCHLYPKDGNPTTHLTALMDQKSRAMTPTYAVFMVKNGYESKVAASLRGLCTQSAAYLLTRKSLAMSSGHGADDREVRKGFLERFLWIGVRDA